jgi:parallel beta-helix repeat protein
MKKLIFFFVATILYSSYSNSQVYMDLQDNMQIPSNSWIIINPGNYVIPDEGNNGVIQINDKDSIMIDAEGVTVDGTNYQGYMIKINNSSYIQINNFDAVSHYYYAVYITNSHHISINNNNFSYNKVDSTGWISVWTNYQSALGGGVMMYQTHTVLVDNNTMKYQNDGVALYHSDSIVIHNNDFAWNTSYGVRMYFSDACNIHGNDCSHVNRPYTDPSDCAAILLIVSNNNFVLNNDLSYSGDGIFLGQYQYSQILNNNYFGYNNCSFSPHNAIEATFADGNVYEFNNCNYSHYGLWLGYSFNSVVRNNEIIGNQYAGIAIDRGFNNAISNNDIGENPTGIELWEGDPISGYQNQFSHDYYIYENNIEGNTTAISLKKSEHSVILTNNFLNNRNGIYILDEAQEDTISANNFRNTTVYHIENKSPQDIYAKFNSFVINDESIISCKIFDMNDNAVYGLVIWQPYIPGTEPAFQEQYPHDMTEPEAVWYAYPEACLGYGLHEPTFIEWDYENKLFGEASVHISTGNGWDIGAMYRPAGDSIASWSVLEEDTLTFWAKSINNTGYGFQYCKVIIGNNCGGYIRYQAPAATILNPTIGMWKRIDIPLAGGNPWSRTIVGDVSFDELSYVEIHADTWDFGFELWLDGLTFNTLFTRITNPESVEPAFLSIYPNPAISETIINFNLTASSWVGLSILDLNGRTIANLVNENRLQGNYSQHFNLNNLTEGVYFVKFICSNKSALQRFVVTH